jgi:site-specific DNA-methyltransferase (adenine-specific)
MEQITPDVTIYLGDAYELITQFPSEAALITDPPYGQDYKSHHNSGRKPSNMVRKDGNFDPILGDDQPFDPSPFLRFSTVCLWGANFYTDKLPASRGWLIWDKLAGKTPCDSSDCELAWTNRDMPVRMFTHLWRGIMRAGEENIVHSPKLHPNQKPVALMQWCLQVLSIPAGTPIVDAFMGSASLGVACYRMGYPYFGLEQDPIHYQTAKTRLIKETQQLRLV